MAGVRVARRQNGRVRGEEERFILDMARALQGYGIPAHRLEETMALLNQKLGTRGQFFSSPSVLMAAFGQGEEQRTFLLRVSSGELDLGKLDLLYKLAISVGEGMLSAAQGNRALAEIVAAPPRYGSFLTLICFTLASAAAARLFGGGLAELLTSALIGLLVGFLVAAAERWKGLGNLIPLFAGLFAIFIAAATAYSIGHLSIYITTLTGLIVLIPGLTLTTALTELATGHPISGTARMANAALTFLMMGFGIALGGKLAMIAFGPFPNSSPIPLEDWSTWVALLVAPLAYLVLFKAKPGDIGWIFISCIFAFSAARAGGQMLGPKLGGFLAALLLGLATNLFARLADRPASITLVPGIMLLVPGSIGFKSLSFLLEKDTLSGLETAFTMVLVAVALVAGLITANLIFSSKRTL